MLEKLRLRFPKRLSVHTILRTGSDCVKLVRKFEKLDYRCCTIEMDLGFLEACTRSNVLPTFLGFKVSNSTLRNSEAYKKCQEKLLREEI